MNLVACPDYEALSRAGCRIVLNAIRAKPDTVLCLPTGGTPERLYALLAEEARATPEQFARVRIIKLDEWVGLGPDAPGSCERHLREQVLDPLGIAPDRHLGFPGDPKDPPADCARIAARLAEWGPIDLCLLGLGLSGHLGFNEPGADPTAGPHPAQLTPETLRHAMVAGRDPAGISGVTLGLGDLLGSRHILLLVAGAGKRDIFRQFIRGPITNALPATLLREHANAECLYDESAVMP